MLAIPAWGYTSFSWLQPLLRVRGAIFSHVGSARRWASDSAPDGVRWSVAGRAELGSRAAVHFRMGQMRLGASWPFLTLFFCWVCFLKYCCLLFVFVFAFCISFLFLFVVWCFSFWFLFKSLAFVGHNVAKSRTECRQLSINFFVKIYQK